MMTHATAPSGGTTLAYAEPAEQPVFPLQWALNGLVIFAIATIAERACIWLILLTILRDRHEPGFGLRDVIDFVLPPIVAATLMWVVLRQRLSASPRLTPLLIGLCAMQFALAAASIAYWSLTVLPQVWAGRGGVHDAVVWEVELVYVRLLPVALPLFIVGIAGFGLPTPRGAAATLMVWSIGTWIAAASATAALWHQRGLRALSVDLYGYTVTPAWTFMLLPIALLGIACWTGIMPQRLRGAACAIAALLWFAAAILHAWFDESMSSVRRGAFAELTNPSNVGGVVAHLLNTLILWQIAPVALLLFLARRPRHEVH